MLNHVQQSSTQGSPSIVILGAREWKMELLAIWQRGFALSEMGVEGAGGGGYRREGVLVMEQVTRGSKHDKGRGAGVAGGGALQRGSGRCWCAWRRARMQGARVSGGVNDPDVCGLWFQASLSLCMVITPSILFSYLL
jgi:hypothetical protein